MHPDRVGIPDDVEPIDIDPNNIPAGGIALTECGGIEVVDGPSEYPYGTLVVRMMKRPTTDIQLTNIQVGWERAGAFIRVMPGTTITKLRVWR